MANVRIVQPQYSFSIAVLFAVYRFVYRSTEMFACFVASWRCSLFLSQSLGIKMRIFIEFRVIQTTDNGNVNVASNPLTNLRTNSLIWRSFASLMHSMRDSFNLQIRPKRDRHFIWFLHVFADLVHPFLELWFYSANNGFFFERERNPWHRIEKCIFSIDLENWNKCQIKSSRR